MIWQRFQALIMCYLLDEEVSKTFILRLFIAGIVARLEGNIDFWFTSVVFPTSF